VTHNDTPLISIDVKKPKHSRMPDQRDNVRSGTYSSGQDCNTAMQKKCGKAQCACTNTRTVTHCRAMREARVNKGAIPLLCEGRHSCQLCDKLSLVPHHCVHLCLCAATDISATGFPSLYCCTIASPTTNYGCGCHDASALPAVDGRINDKHGGADMRKSRWRKIATPFGSRVCGDACWV
jgi:hypothetical protein